MEYLSKRVKAMFGQYLFIHSSLTLGSIPQDITSPDLRATNQEVRDMKIVVRAEFYGAVEVRTPPVLLARVFIDLQVVPVESTPDARASRVKGCPGSAAGPRPERRRSRDSSLRSALRLPKLSLMGRGFEG